MERMIFKNRIEAGRQLAGRFIERGYKGIDAMDCLHLVRSPTLLIVGGEDRPVISLNESAYGKLRCPKEMVVVLGATHLFEEPGALERVAELARDWFLKYFIRPMAEKTDQVSV